MNRILVVDDESSIANMIKLCLDKNGYYCETVNNGEEAAKRIEERAYDLVLLDIMLPDIDGYDLIKYIKEYDVPVIFISAKISVSDKVKGLKLGAEDYIIKPFDLEELLARVETVLRRYHKTERFLTAGEISIDTLSRMVTLKERIIPLPAKEYELLLYLFRNKKYRIISRNDIREGLARAIYGKHQNS